MNTSEIVEHLEHQRECLDDAIAALNGIGPKIRRNGRRKMSAEARRRISLARESLLQRLWFPRGRTRNI